MNILDKIWKQTIEEEIEASTYSIECKSIEEPTEVIEEQSVEEPTESIEE
jgi:hypothetical protein